MSFDEALIELGISDASDQVAVRRAYLSKIKVHKPEIDPDGFQRVRAAYELLLGPQRHIARGVRQSSSSSRLASETSPSGASLTTGSGEVVEQVEGPGAPIEAPSFDEYELESALEEGEWKRALGLWKRAGAQADDLMSDSLAWKLTFSLEGAGYPRRAEHAYALWQAREERDRSARRADPLLGTLAAEFFQRASELNANARMMVGRAIHDQDWDAAPGRVAEFLGLEGGAARVSMRDAFHDEAPNLYQVLGGRPRLIERSKSTLSWAHLVVVMVAVGAMRICLTAPVGGWSRSPRPSVDEVVSKATSEVRSPGMPGDRKALLEALPSESGLPLGLPIAYLRVVSARQDCKSILASLRELERWIDVEADDGPVLGRQFDPFRGVLQRECEK